MAKEGEGGGVLLHSTMYTKKKNRRRIRSIQGNQSNAFSRSNEIRSSFSSVLLPAPVRTDHVDYHVVNAVPPTTTRGRQTLKEAQGRAP